MSETDFPYKSICVFGYGNIGKQLYDAILRISPRVNCIFCDNDNDKHTLSDVEVISPKAAAMRLKSQLLDAILISEAYSYSWRKMMITQLSSFGVGEESIFLAGLTLSSANQNSIPLPPHSEC